MDSNQVMKNLHDKATRGETLSIEENKRLQNWYLEQDEIEDEVLNSDVSDSAINDLQKKVFSAASQLSAVSRELESLSRQNELLRQENDELRQKLAPTSKAA